MKRIVAIMVVLLQLLPATWASAKAESAEKDPIIGCWYLDMETTADLSLSWEDTYIRAVMLLTFEENGAITRVEIDYTENGPEIIGPAKIGKWEKGEGNKYTLSIVALGIETAHIYGEELLAIAVVKDYYYRFHKMIGFNWFLDILTK